MTEDISPVVKTFESNSALNTNINPTQNIALFVGEFEKGKINEPVLITSALQYKLVFGRATETNYNTWYQVYNYLLYPGGPKIWVCRVAGSGSVKANKNYNIASSEGEWGNLLTVEIYRKSAYNNYLKDIFNFYNINDIKNEWLVIIRRKNIIVETFNINSSSEMNSSYLESINLEEGIFKLDGGRTVSAMPSDYKETFDMFTKEDYEIDIVIAPEDHNNIVIDFVENRKDCVAFLNIPQKYIDFLLVNNNILETESSEIIIINEHRLKRIITDKDFNNIKNYLNTLKKSSYCFFIFGFKIQLDKFTDKKRVISVAGDIAGLKAASSNINPWNIGAGILRGTLKEYTELSMKINDKIKTELYKMGINTLTNATLMTQKMFVDNSFNINKLYTRNIFNYLERKAEKILRRYIFELNDYRLRGKITSELKMLLEDIVDSKGIDAGKVEVHNIDGNIIINIYIKLIGVAEVVKIGIANTGNNSVDTVIQFKEL